MHTGAAAAARGWALGCRTGELLQPHLVAAVKEEIVSGVRLAVYLAYPEHEYPGGTEGFAGEASKRGWHGAGSEGEVRRSPEGERL